MNRTTRAPGYRRLASLAFVAVLGLAVIVPTTLAGTYPVPSAAAVSAAESAMVAALNADRAAVGLVAVQVDPRLMVIARARSVDMASKHYFSHSQPDGRNVFDIINAAKITSYGAGEIIAYNYNGMDSTVSGANSQWMNSPGHKAIVISTTYNYIGVGLAVDPTNNRKIWTAVYLRGPDRTYARATLTGAALRAGPDASTRYATVTWSGYDPQLQVLTAGLAYFSVQRRIDGGAWQTVTWSTTLTAMNFQVKVGHVTEFQIRARDRNSNYGPWSRKVVDLR